jgi:hypothetical protein
MPRKKRTVDIPDSTYEEFERVGKHFGMDALQVAKLSFKLVLVVFHAWLHPDMHLVLKDRGYERIVTIESLTALQRDVKNGLFRDLKEAREEALLWKEKYESVAQELQHVQQSRNEI